MVKYQQMNPFGLLFYYAGSQSCSPLHGWGGMRDHWLFHLIHQGYGTVWMAGQNRTLTAGDGFLLPPDTEIHYRASDHNPWAYSWFACSGTLAQSCFEACGLGPYNCLYHSSSIDFSALNAQFFQNIAELVASTDPFDQIAKLYGIFALLRFHANNTAELLAATRPQRPADAYWQAVQSYIQSNYSRTDTRIESLSQRIGVSSKHLASLIKARCGKSPRALLTDYRLNKACDLLGQSGLSIGAIASSVGYSDPLSFSRAFHQYFGMAPSSWRTGMHQRTDGRI